MSQVARNTRPSSHRILYTSTTPGSVTSAAPRPPVQACCRAMFSTVTDELPRRNGTVSMPGSVAAAASLAGAAATAGAVAVAGIARQVGIVLLLHALSKNADKIINRFIRGHAVRLKRKRAPAAPAMLA